MKINVSYLVDETNRRVGVQIPYAEWKQLKQRLLDAEMQYWEIQKLEGSIRHADLVAAIAEIKAAEASTVPASSLANAFADSSQAIPNLDSYQPLVLPSFINKANLLAQKYPLLISELKKLSKAQVSGFATRVDSEYLSVGWRIENKKSKRSPAMRIEIHFLHKAGVILPDTISKEPVYLVAIYDKTDQKLVPPEPLELL